MTPKAAKKSVTTTEKTGRKAGKSAHSAVGPLIPQPHGGAIRPGRPANPVAGTGRPPDAIRAKLRELGAEKSIPFLSDLLDGKIQAYLVGKCEKCQHEQGFDAETMEYLMTQVKASVDQRLKASEQTLKHGLQSKELVIASDTAAAFFDCVHTAIVELGGDALAEQVKARALQLMEAKA